MQFLRKYQRYIFILITAFIVISFSFFGTFSLQWGGQKKQEVRIAQLLGGAPLTYSAIEKMSRFLFSDSESLPTMRERFMPNLFNDGIIQKEFLESKIADLLVQNYFEEMKPHLHLILERTKRFVPYAHPEAKALSSMEVWNQFAPSIALGVLELKKEKEVSNGLFSHLVSLYLAEKKFPPEMLRRVLIYQQNQHPSLPVDMRLVQEDFSLFCLHSISDWFGQNFIDMISQFVLQVASVAKEKGYQVSDNEVLFELKENLKKGCKKWNVEVKEGDFHQHARILGMTKEELVDTYRQILLFRRYFHDMGGNVFLDPLPLKEISSFASEAVSLELFALPSSLQLKNFQELLQLELYLKAISSKERQPLELALSTDSVGQVEKRAPELVAKRYQIRLKETSKERVCLRIGERELWDWEMKESSFQLLKEKFPFLTKANAETLHRRFESLEKLSLEKREEVDRFARSRILADHPEWIADSLHNAEEKEMALDLHFGMSKVSLEGILKKENLYRLLEQAPLFTQTNLKPEEKKARDALKFFTEDGEHYYSIEILRKDEGKRVLLFAEAQKDGTLQEMLDSYLQEHFADAKQKRPDLFGAEKSFHEAKDIIGRVLFFDLLKAIDQDYRKQLGKSSWAEGMGSLDFYAKHRLYFYMRKQRDKVMNQKDLSSFLQKDELSLAEQWKLKEKQVDVDRSSDLAWVKEALFKKKKTGDWSSVHVEPSGEISFFHILGKKQNGADFEADLLFNQKSLSFEAERYLASKILKKIQEKKAIVLPIRKEE